jgi:signal transduction histidine kinase
VASRSRAAGSAEPPANYAWLTIKTALFIGFGLTFGLWLATGYQFTQRMNDLQSRATAINIRYMHAQELLSAVRTQILLASVYLRDALLDPDPETADNYRRELEEASTLADEALRQYVPVLNSASELERVAHLRHEIDAFRSMLMQVLETDSSRWPAMARVILRTLVMPKREVVIRVSDEVQTLNQNAFVQLQAEIAETHLITQRQLWARLGIALASSLGIALLAAWYAGRLENRIRRQSAKDVQNAKDLHRLSAALIHAQEEERRTIARELHDEVGQVLTALRVELAVAQHAVEAAGGPTHALEDVRSITDGALHTVRDLSHLLHPALLDDLGLPAAIEAYLKSFGKRHGIRAELLHDHMDERLSPELETSIYRIVQEGLTNVARHSKAAACRVYLQRLPTTVLVTIEDDGVGFDVAEAEAVGSRRGLGLLGIRERAANLRGTLRLESALGKGVRLTVEVPAPAEPFQPETISEAPTADAAPAAGPPGLAAASQAMSEAVHG